MCGVTPPSLTSPLFYSYYFDNGSHTGLYFDIPLFFSYALGMSDNVLHFPITEQESYSPCVCGNNLFFLTDDGVICASCGVDVDD